MKIDLPTPSLVLLVGASGSGKSTFARKHFRPTEVISSDTCRGLVSDDENDQSASKDAFEVLGFIAGKRLGAGLLTVIDATNVQPEARKPLVALARAHDLQVAAIVLDLPDKVCLERNASRPDRSFGAHVVRGQTTTLRRSLRKLRDEGVRHTWVLRSPEDVDAATIVRTPLWTDRRSEHGPFDLIGDVHGCGDELEALLAELGYVVHREEPSPEAPFGVRVTPPAGRRAVFLGDLVDRGPRIADVLKLAMSMVRTGAALAVPGNHEAKLLRKLSGKDVRLTHGLAETVAQLEAEPEEFRRDVARFLDGLVSHMVLDDGKLVASHAGMKQAYQGRASGRVREFALYGDTTGETDAFGLPVRRDWASEYRGKALVVYGHTPVAESHFHNGTINIDNGCVFGGALTALRYPERDLVTVPAARTYYEPARPIGSVVLDARGDDELLDLSDVLGRRSVQTSLLGRITIREELASAALEVMSRFAVDPRWLVYLPPTMSPPETTSREGLLEHPDEAFAYFRHEGIERVVCEEKHMGSRAVMVVCRDEEAGRARFGIAAGGVIATRTGRPFFDDARQAEVLARTRAAIEKAGLWDELGTSWVVLDAEIMPWSAKARELLRTQYAPVGAAARASLDGSVRALEAAKARGLDVGELLARFQGRQDAAHRYVDAYRRYCWTVDGVAGLSIAPFHLLASEGGAHVRREHTWHLETLARLAAADPGLFRATASHVVELGDPASERAGVAWWDALTSEGGEGMVVKPLAFLVRSKRGVVQPAIKVRGRDYLRIIYGPEYTAAEHLARLRSRNTNKKRALASRELSLGVEALERFVRKEPLYRVHECVFGVLALESEPIDPRL